MGGFKYYGFLAARLGRALGALGLEVWPVTLDFFLPLWVSNNTFQTLGYTIYVYPRRVGPCQRCSASPFS